MNSYLEVSLRTKMLVSFIGLLFIGYIIYLLYNKKLTENFALGWIVITLAAMSSVIFHAVLKYLAIFSGIKFGALAISFYSFVFIFAMLILFSIKISLLIAQNKKLAQTIGLLEMKIDQLEKSG
ncbi:DUF2304 domain-containing protein [candidate division KSB1 bacterium]|nr:DUF2304 domain-containing protein [candidate division KSB1 bacterium]